MYIREYPIRCKSCNEQLACYSDEYERLAVDIGCEKALNLLNIMEPCSRNNMMNPEFILITKENRNLIEGIKNSENFDEFAKDISFKKYDNTLGNSDYQIHNEYKPDIKNEDNKKKSILIQKKNVPLSSSLISKKSTYISNVGISQRSKILKPKTKALSTYNDLELKYESEQDDLIKIFDENKEFILPTVIGIPTINQTGDNQKIYINEKYTAEVLTGRTYLAH